jgi:hypothetical protein
VLVAGATQAGEYRVSTAGKTPAQVRASIAGAAAEACKAAYDGDPAGYYERPVCEREAYKSGVSRYQRLRAPAPSVSARRAPSGDAVIAGR